MTYEYQHEIVQSWFDRRGKDGGAFDRFIFVWIAFNAALSARYGRGPDREKVERFGQELAQIWPDLLERDSDIKDAATELARLSPIYAEPPRVDGTREETYVDAGDGASVLGGIYAVRNNLFHGSKEFDAVRDHALVTTSTRVMEGIFLRSGLYAMAREAERDLTEALGVSDDELPAAG